MAAVKPDLATHSGWCMKWPVSEWNQAEHDGCPKHFATRDCACPCDHPGEKSLVDRGITRYEVTKPKTKKEQVGEKEDDSAEV